MRSVALGVIEDLRKRCLMPVALILIAALIAVPVFLLKSAEAPAPVTAAGPPVAVRADGLPTPQQVLSSDKPLVSLAVLDTPSDLDSFASRNPFKPLDAVSKTGVTASQATGSGSASPGSPGSPGSPAAAAGLGGGGTGGPGGGGAGAGGGGTSGSGGTGGGSTDMKPVTPQAPTPIPAAKPEKLTYALDATLTGPSRTVHYRNVQKTQILPSIGAPLFIFLGVDDTGNNAVFLIDSTLTVVAGEGTCRSSNENCATLSIEPGQIEVFSDDKGRRYELQIDQIREVSATSAARAQTKKLESAAKSATRAATQPQRRFMPPMITDLFIGEQS